MQVEVGAFSYWGIQREIWVQFYENGLFNLLFNRFAVAPSSFCEPPDFIRGYEYLIPSGLTPNLSKVPEGTGKGFTIYSPGILALLLDGDHLQRNRERVCFS